MVSKTGKAGARKVAVGAGDPKQPKVGDTLHIRTRDGVEAAEVTAVHEPEEGSTAERTLDLTVYPSKGGSAYAVTGIVAVDENGPELGYFYPSQATEEARSA